MSSSNRIGVHFIGLFRQKRFLSDLGNINTYAEQASKK
jgi:hypothetical protein